MTPLDWVLCGGFTAFIVYMTVIEPRHARSRVIYDVTGDLSEVYVLKKRPGIH